jgi:L-alanine-DL-glutamate epimerase-like enolase superfamily enzyme
MNPIKQIHYRQIVRPLKTLFATSLGRKSAATSVLATVVLDDGTTGVGEAPTSFVLPHETTGSIKRILEEAREVFAGVPIEEYGQTLDAFRGRHQRFHMTVAGLEVALFRALLAQRRTSEFAHWGARWGKLETDITVPFIPAGDMLQRWLGRVTKVGFRTYKVKVSGKVGADIRFVRRVREILSEGLEQFTIRLDGNQGYTAGSCLRMLDRLDSDGIAIELFEQPLRKDDYAGLKRIRGRSAVPVILDETVFNADDCRRVIDEQLGDGVNIKIAKSGIAQSAAILKLAKAAGLKLMLGCMTETMVGLSAGIYLAAGSGAFDFIDLDSIHLMAHRNRYGGIAIAGRHYVLEGA